nr:MAG TPA: hypothetical protein [Caudoviricetes sp.]
MVRCRSLHYLHCFPVVFNILYPSFKLNEHKQSVHYIIIF